MNIDSPSLPPLPPSGGSSAPAPAPASQRVRTGACTPTSGACAGSAPAQLRSTHGDFDAARVAEIRASLREGSYRVNFDNVADGLLAHLNDLPPRS